MHFLKELQNTEFFFTLLKSDSTTDALAAIFIILGNKGSTCGGVNFRYSYRWIYWTARIF